MSKIKSELLAATKLKAERGETTAELLERLIPAVVDLSKRAWEGLSEEAKAFFNEYADALNDKLDPPDSFPDEEPEEAEPEPAKAPAKTVARRGANKTANAAPVMKVGSKVEITNKRGKVFKGTVVEIDDDIVVVDTGAGEEEIDRGRIESVTIHHGEVPDDDADDEPADPFKVGAKVEATNKRGVITTGTIVEIDDDILVLDVDGKEVELTRSRLESVKILGGTKASPKKEETTSRRSTPVDRKAEKSDEPEGKAPRASNAPGVSIGTAIKELMAADTDMTEEEVGKALKKQGLEFKDNTLKLNYVDCRKFLDILKAHKRLKA